MAALQPRYSKEEFAQRGEALYETQIRVQVEEFIAFLVVRSAIDTGYTGDLMLPRAIVDELELSLQAIQDAILGDVSLTTFEMYAGSVIWDGQVRRIEINASETECLVGMGLLEEYKLEIGGMPGGKRVFEKSSSACFTTLTTENQ